jgi:hypothetical protein
MRAVAAAFVALLLAGLLAGCSEGSGTDQVSNAQDNFRYTADWQGKGGSKSFDWANTKAAASVSMPVNMTGGSVTLHVKDGAGSEVYSNTMSSSGRLQATTATGTPGTWHIELDYSGFSGSLVLQLRAA